MKQDLEKLRHARSVKDFPEIDLEEGEFVELAIRRSKRGLILIWAAEVAGLIALTAILILFAVGGADGSIFNVNDAAKSYLYLIIFALYAVVIVSGLVGTFIYKNNLLVITNKRAIQKTRCNLLTSSTNIIELSSVEDVSFRKSGLFDYVFSLGTIRMATVGDETTYTFPFVDTPRDEIKTISSLVHKAKERKTAATA
jgi:hypothetical protein